MIWLNDICMIWLMMLRMIPARCRGKKKWYDAEPLEGLALWSIFEGMNIHKIQAILMRTEGVQGFDPDGFNIDPNMVSSFKGFPASKEYPCVCTVCFCKISLRGALALASKAGKLYWSLDDFDRWPNCDPAWIASVIKHGSLGNRHQWASTYVYICMYSIYIYTVYI